MQSHVKFNRVPETARPGQQGSEEGLGEGFREVSGEGSGRLWCRAGRARFNEVPDKVPQGSTSGATGSEKVPVKVWEALVQSQVKFNRVAG